MRSLLLLGILLLSCQGKDSKAPEDMGLCQKSGLSEANSFRVGWKVLKNGSATVLGSIGGRGLVDLKEGGLNGSLLEIDFNAQSMESGIALRDERIINIFLMADTFSHVGFKGTIISEKTSLPRSNGEKVPVEIDGVLNIVGQSLSMRLKAEVVRVQNSIYLTQRGEPESFLLLANDMLKANAQNLLRTANVKSMSETIDVWGSVPIVETCGE